MYTLSSSGNSNYPTSRVSSPVCYYFQLEEKICKYLCGLSKRECRTILKNNFDWDFWCLVTFRTLDVVQVNVFHAHCVPVFISRSPPLFQNSPETILLHYVLTFCEQMSLWEFSVFLVPPLIRLWRRNFSETFISSTQLTTLSNGLFNLLILYH